MTDIAILEPKDRLTLETGMLQNETDNEIKVWTGLVQVIGAIILVVGGYFTWRNLIVAQEGQITNRFTQAIGQLGAELKDGEPNLEVRLGGIYALERIARDSSRDHWPIMEVLTAYVRQNAPWPPRSITSPSPALWTPRPVKTMDGNSGTDESTEAKPPPRADIQAILTVLGRRVLAGDRQESAELDLRETDLRRADLQGAHLEKANLNGAHLERAHLLGAHLEGARLNGAHLEKVNLDVAHVKGAYLYGAHLERSQLWGAHLDGAHLNRDQLNSAVSWGRAVLRPDLVSLQYEDETPADV